MSGAILKGRIAKREEEITDDRTPEEHILDGDYNDDNGIPWAYRLNSISPDLLNQLGEEHEYRNDPPSRV